MYDSDVLTDAGRAFHASAAATGNAPSPSVVPCVVGTSSVDVDPERSRQRDLTLDVRWSVSVRYDGVIYAHYITLAHCMHITDKSE